MLRDEVIASIRRHEAELRSAGVSSISLFGSVARGEDGPSSDLDVAVRLESPSGEWGLRWFSMMDAIRQKLENLIGREIDLVCEPVRKESLRRAIDQDRCVAFQ